MGRIKTMRIKRNTFELFNRHKDDFVTDFSENKILVRKFANVPSKKIRNILAGYLTRLEKTKDKI